MQFCQTGVRDFLCVPGKRPAGGRVGQSRAGGSGRCRFGMSGGLGTIGGGAFGARQGEIMAGLEAHPEFRGGIEQAGETEGKASGYRGMAGENPRDKGCGDIKVPGDLTGGEAEGSEEFGGQNLAGMGRNGRPRHGCRDCPAQVGQIGRAHV